MDAKQLTEAILDGGIPSTNFFNGRMLSGEDLTREQESNREARRRLARSVGAGVADGLEVAVPVGIDTRHTPVVEVAPGLALNRRGDTLKLSNATRVSLVHSTDAPNAPTAAPFNDCDPFQPDVYAADAGIYLLAISPASARTGRAPVSGLGNVAAACNTNYTFEGVQFRLIQLPLAAAEMRDAQRLRRHVAHLCLGFYAARAGVKLPFAAPPAGSGLLDNLPASRRLTECDVPLAIIHWTNNGGIDFVDLWSVRRHVTRRRAAGQWGMLADARRASEATAMFLQFQEHIDALCAPPNNPQTLVATEHFRYLPPVGFVPTIVGGATRGVEYRTFFSGLTVRPPVFVEAARCDALFREAVAYAPIDLASGELIWLYEVRENRQRAAERNAPPSYLIFASGHMPFRGEARFDVSRWNYSNYSSPLDK